MFDNVNIHRFSDLIEAQYRYRYSFSTHAAQFVIVGLSVQEAVAMVSCWRISLV